MCYSKRLEATDLGKSLADFPRDEQDAVLAQAWQDATAAYEAEQKAKRRARGK